MAVRVTAPDGKLLFAADRRLGDLFWDRDGSIMRGAGFFPFESPNASPLFAATAYRMRITVLQPSLTPGEKLRVIGTGE